MSRLRCATYARYSTDKQNPLSIEDQVRKCQEFAKQRGWEFLQEWTYADEEISGATLERPGLREMLSVAESPNRPFDVILAEDTSRLSRKLADILNLCERLKFAGVRLCFVSQGIDSSDEQFQLLIAARGMIDQLFLTDTAKRVHRGMEGRALKGLHPGGRTYGYRSVPAEEGKKLEVNEGEAALVRRVFQMSASGLSLKAITKKLNAEGIPPPRPRAGKGYGTWCPSMIQGMLRRETYIGQITWNRSRFVKAPGSNKRLRRARPENEWRVIERPELRIISDQLWQAVQERLVWLKQHYGGGRREGLLNRAASSSYLFSGFLKCGSCGANLTIVTGRKGRKGTGRYPRWGCPQNFYRGTCSNKLKEREDWVEKRLLAELQDAVLQPAAINYAIEEFGRQLKASLANLSGELATMRERKDKLESELRRLAAGVAEGGHSSFLLEAIAERERELREITARLLSEGPGSVEAQVADIRRFVTERLQNLPELLAGDVLQARAELAKHIDEIRLVPRRQLDGECYYRAVGQWNLLGAYAEKDRIHALLGGRARSLARSRKLPTALLIPFQRELIHAAA